MNISKQKLILTKTASSHGENLKKLFLNQKLNVSCYKTRGVEQLEAQQNGPRERRRGQAPHEEKVHPLKKIDSKILNLNLR